MLSVCELDTSIQCFDVCDPLLMPGSTHNDDWRIVPQSHIPLWLDAMLVDQSKLGEFR